MTRKEIFLFAIVAGFLCLMSLFQGRIHGAENFVPNILLVIVDDMGYGDPGCYGGKVTTPQIDRLAFEGMRFTAASSGCCVCAPSRCTLLTGYHMGHASVRNNSGGVHLIESDITLAMMLKPHGYHVGGFGKWGLADTNSLGVPEKKGFNEFFGFYHQIHAHDHYTDYLWRNSIREEQRSDLNGNPPYAQYAVVENAKRFIRESAATNKPFFCYCPWTPPHGKFVIPNDDPAVALYQDHPWPQRVKTLAAMQSMVDRHLGELMDLLEELKLDDSTIVIFTSDNGAASRNEGTLNSAGPFRGEKGNLYEGGLRVPFIVKWPRRIAAGSETDFPIVFYDVPATLLELIGGKMPERGDGISFAPTLLGNSSLQQKHDYFYWEYEPVDWSMAVPGRTTIPAKREQAVRMADWKGYRKTPDMPIEIYDLVADPGEKNDLAEKHPDIVARIREIMLDAREDMRPQPEPAHPIRKTYN